jgi:hypothetical protein
MSENVNWQRLHELRQIFIGETRSEGDYWLEPNTLESYDATFAQRIGWKWDYVMGDVLRSGWVPDWSIPVCDWACGTGIAIRAYLESTRPGLTHQARVSVFDRSMAAMQFAATHSVMKEYPVSISTGEPGGKAFYLISHVLTEMTGDQLMAIKSHLRGRATGFIWVEPGAYGPSRILSQLRDQMLGDFFPWSPCPDSCACPAMAPDRWEDWCHFFAPTPSPVFHDSFWAQFSANMEIDLRSLPVSFLCMDRRRPTHHNPKQCRFLGRPRILKHQAGIDACFQGKYRKLTASKRHSPQIYKRLKKGALSHLAEVDLLGDEILNISGIIEIPGDLS